MPFDATFQFAPGQRVMTPFGDLGIVDFVGVGRGLVPIYRVMRTHQTVYFSANELTRADDEIRPTAEPVAPPPVWPDLPTGGGDPSTES